MNSLLSRTIIRFSSCNLTWKTIHSKNFEVRFGCYSTSKTAGVGKSRMRKSVAAAAEIMIMKEEEEEKNGFFVVRKGDLVGVYNNLIDCQAQVGSSVCDLPVSVYKGYSMSKESEAYLVSGGLTGALYTIRAIDLREGLFGNLQNPAERRFLGSESGGACFLEFDGACKGNPGPSGAGAVLRTADGTLAKNSEADAQANLAVVLAAGEEEVNTGKTECQSQQSMGLHTLTQVSSSDAHNF